MMEQHNRISISACSQSAISQHSTQLSIDSEHSSYKKAKQEAAKQRPNIEQMNEGQGQANEQKDKFKDKQQQKNSQKSQNEQPIQNQYDIKMPGKGDHCEPKCQIQNATQIKSVLQPKTMGNQPSAKDISKEKISQDILGKGKQGEHRVFRKGDLIVNAKKNITYQAIELIGTGTFGQVLSVISISKGQHGQTFNKMALKVIKNQPAYINQGLMQIKSLREIAKHEQLLLKKINENGQKTQIEADKSYLRLFDGFMWQGHLCIAMELMDNSILNILQSSRYKGIDMKWIQKWGKEIILMLAKIHKLGIIHCDIKPQNIMFRPQKPEKPILIDFSSSSISNSPIFTYIQSRFYRSPEVLIGTLPYTDKIDIWSLGCLLAEMYLGLPIFPGASAYDQISKIFKLCKCTDFNIQVDSLDEQTLQMVRKSKFGLEFFEIKQQVIQAKKIEEQRSEQYNNQAFRRNKIENQNKQEEVKNQLTLKPLKAYERVFIRQTQQKKEKVQINQQYFEISCLNQLVSFRNPPARQLQTHELFVDLIKKLLVFNPENRITAEEAFLHPFFGSTFSELEPIRVLEDMIFQEKSSGI